MFFSFQRNDETNAESRQTGGKVQIRQIFREFGLHWQERAAMCQSYSRVLRFKIPRPLEFGRFLSSASAQ